VHGTLTTDQRASLARIKQNERTLLRLIEDVLDYAKLESGRMRYCIAEVPIDDVLRTLEAFVAPSLQQKGLEYHFEPCGPDLKIRADRDKTEQVLLNLLSNAVKCTDHGRVTVRCGTRDDVVEILVCDTGRGIPEDSLETIFEPFIQEERLTGRSGGTGLGLSISRQLARDMGGDVLVSSRVGRGSTFTLVLPRA